MLAALLGGLPDPAFHRGCREHSIVDCPTVHNGRMQRVRVLRVQVLDPLPGQAGGEQDRPGGLVDHVATQVPRHRLEPGEAVDRIPRRDPVPAVGQPQQRVLQAGRRTGVLVQPGVHTGRVVLQVPPGLRGEDEPFLFSDAAPAHRAKVPVGLHLGPAEQLGEPAGGQVPAEVHLPEPFLRVHVSLRGEQVVGAVRVHLRDGLRVAVHERHQHLAARIGERLDERRTLRVQEAHEIGMRIVVAALEPLHEPCQMRAVHLSRVTRMATREFSVLL